MSIKPSVVYIKGVHDIADPNPSTAPDIGFPNIGLDKLFEGAILKEYTGDYDPSKEYVYKSTTSNVAIENEYHFNCIKNGYDSINGINHYYTLNGNNYIYNTADTSTWEGKWALSNAIKDKNLYSIDSEADRIYIINDGYYEKNDNNYVKQTVKSYNLYEEGPQVLWDDNHKYKQTISEIEDDEGITNYIAIWKKASDNAPATTGYYLSIDEVPDTNGNKTYNVKLCNLTFNANGVATSGDPKGTLYKLEISSLDTAIDYYIKNSNNLVKLELDTSITFTTNPADNKSLYVYQKLELYTYPNIVTAPESTSLYTDSGSSIYNSFNKNNFPVYETATATKISKTPHESYTVYEKTAVKVNYYYSNEASSLQFVFTDKDIDGVLEACNLPNDIGLEKYVHLTNLEYNKN